MNFFASDILSNKTYRNLFFAQVIALIGTGLATVALGLLAYDIAGGDAGTVLGTAMAIKMIAYIGIAPIVGAYANRLPRRAFLVAMDLVRAGVAICLPFVDQVWQIYILIFLLQSASAAFTPTFQATIPDVLPKEKDYTRALSLSRLAYDMESLTSPMLAAALLTIIDFHWLFSGTAVGFALSALLVMATILPKAASTTTIRKEGVIAKTTRGMRFYLKTPRLRGLLAITLAAAAASSMVIVNTVVIVRDTLGLSQTDVAITLAAFGGGSIIAAFLLPRLLDRISDRRIMILSAIVMTVALAVLTGLTAAFSDLPSFWYMIMAGWFVMGFPAIFAAQFSLSHACWLICYPLVGWLGAKMGQEFAFGAMAVIAFAGTLTGFMIWPANDPDIVPHGHENLAPDHPHLKEAHASKDGHAFVIDDLHQQWPRG